VRFAASEWIVGDPYTGLSRAWRWKAFYELRVIRPKHAEQ